MTNCRIRMIPESIKRLDISDEEYFGKNYTNYISNSKLSLINEDEGGSPKKFKEGLSANKIETEALTLGSTVHQVVLQPKEFWINNSVSKPSGKLFYAVEDMVEPYLKGVDDYELCLAISDKYNYFKGKITEENFREKIMDKCIPYLNYVISDDYKTHDDRGREYIYLDSYTKYRAISCIKSVNSSDASKLFKPEGLGTDPLTFNEDTFICDIEVDYEGKKVVLPLKLKIDNWTLDFELGILTLNDLKTTGKEIKYFKDSFEKYHYARQMALYFWVLNEYSKREYSKIFTKHCNIVVVETNKPFSTKVFPVSEKLVIEGLREFKRLITKVTYHEINGYE